MVNHVHYCPALSSCKLIFMWGVARYTIIIFLLLLFYSGRAQVLYTESAWLDYYRLVELKNNGLTSRLNIFSSVVHPNAEDSLDWQIWEEHFPLSKEEKKMSILPIRLSNYYNSRYPKGGNDGALWKGRGYTGALQGGVQGRIGILYYTFCPVVYHVQNKAFPLADQQGSNHPYNYQFTNKRIDFVQRYGEDSFTAFDLGQSEIRLVLGRFTIGASTQNITWGPAQQNPLLLSNNAGGIPHIDLGAVRPIKTGIGEFEGKIYLGQLKKSDYFDEDEQWDYRYWTGLSVSYSPSFLPSLILGFNRSFYKKQDDVKISDYWVVVTKFDDVDGDPAVNDEYDQMGSVTLRWLFKEVGFETYLEYGKNDFGGKIWGTAPEHARAYVLGFSKAVDISDSKLLKLTYEHTTLDRAKNYIYRGYNSWYAHSIVQTGYSINGQLIGASIGTGSKSNYMEAQYFFPKGRLKLVAQAIRFNDDYFYINIQDEYTRDHEWTLASGFSRFLGSFLLDVDVAVSFRQNQYYVRDNDKTNWQLGLSITKIFN